MNHKSISVVITVGENEPYLEQTIANIKNNIACKHEIIVVYDGQQPNNDLPVDQIIHLKSCRGVGPARHVGIKIAKHSLIFLTDAHMDFSNGFGKTILDWHNQSKVASESHLSCGRSIGLVRAGDELKRDTSHNATGARFSFKSIESENQHWIMSGKWAKQNVNGLIGCVYGACYAFSKKWYKAIGEPLALLRGWGMDEEYLSAATWFAGGRVVLLDYEAAHFFKNKKSGDVPEAVKRQFLINQLLFLNLLPLPEADRKNLQEWLNLNTLLSGHSIEATKTIQTAMTLWKSWEWNKLEPWIDYTTALITMPGPLNNPIHKRKQATLLNLSVPKQSRYVPRLKRKAV